MARTNLAAARIAPTTPRLLNLAVVRREQVTPHMMRVTLGGPDLHHFHVLGRDQWFRLFLPVGGHDEALARVPAKLDTLTYLKFLTIAKSARPVLRNYTVRAFRADGALGPELDVDLVLHEAPDGSAGPAARWAATCAAGDPVAVLDEGVTFNPSPELPRTLLVTDETGLPAVAGILAAMPRDAVGQALIEIPTGEDSQPLDAPPGVEVRWVVRPDPTGTPGRAVLAVVRALPPVAADGLHVWTVGEAALPAGVRRHLIAAGLPKEQITFCGYWKAPRGH